MANRNAYEKRSIERIQWLIETYCEGSQASFVERTGLHKSTVSLFANGLHIPSKNSTEKIADAFGVSKEWVLGYDVPMRPASAASEGITSLPVYERIPGGVPLDQLIDIAGHAEFADDRMEEGKTYFAYLVPDDSMQPRILKGDIVIASAGNQAASGDLVIVSVDHADAVIRRLKIYENSIALFADNPAHPPQYFPDGERNAVRIIGRVRELRARF